MNGLVSASGDDKRPVSEEFHGIYNVSESDEIAALEESRLLTTGSETVFSER